MHTEHRAHLCYLGAIENGKSKKEVRAVQQAIGTRGALVPAGANRDRVILDVYGSGSEKTDSGLQIR
jgi:hypothetical protein